MLWRCFHDHFSSSSTLSTSLYLLYPIYLYPSSPVPPSLPPSLSPSLPPSLPLSPFPSPSIPLPVLPHSPSLPPSLSQRHDPYNCRQGGVNETCYDRLDLTLCFEDTAVLGGICVIFWLLAGVLFLCGSRAKPALQWSLLHLANLARGGRDVGWEGGRGWEGRGLTGGGRVGR